jgi:hypothetical protein
MLARHSEPATQISKVQNVRKWHRADSFARRERRPLLGAQQTFSIASQTVRS